MQLSPHFSLAEMVRSQTAARRGLNNAPPGTLLPTLIKTADRMEKVRTICGNRPIFISSGYRSSALNDLVGGSSTSDHRFARAVDFTVAGLTISDTIALIRKSPLGFDQLIDEFGSWVHIGFGPRMRQQVLSARRIGGKVVYKSL